MNTPLTAERELDEVVDIDPVQEIRLRIWARKNYTSAENRDAAWHPVILDEMEQKDSEA
jgi:hypothetical protein